MFLFILKDHVFDHVSSKKASMYCRPSVSAEREASLVIKRTAVDGGPIFLMHRVWFIIKQFVKLLHYCNYYYFHTAPLYLNQIRETKDLVEVV